MSASTAPLAAASACSMEEGGKELGGSMAFTPGPPCAWWLTGTNRPTRLPEHSRDCLILGNCYAYTFTRQQPPVSDLSSRRPAVFRPIVPNIYLASDLSHDASIAEY